VIGREAGEPLGAPEQAQEHPNTIDQEGRIRRRMNGHGHHGTVDAHSAPRLDRAGRGPRDDKVVEHGQRPGHERPEIRRHRRLRGRRRERAHATEGPVARRIGDMEGQLLVAPIVQLAGEREA